MGMILTAYPIVACGEGHDTYSNTGQKDSDDLVE